MSLAERVSSRLSELNIKPKDILQFAKEDLGLDLFPAQIFILKVFYSIPLSNDLSENCIKIGDRFNENVIHIFTEQQFLDYLYKSNRINIKEIDPDQLFIEVVFVIGRRGTKTTMSSIITLYTIYKILLLPNPHEYFGILQEDEIGVAIVSNNRDGAERQFRTISQLIYKSPFFKKHLVKDPSGGQLFLRSKRLMETEDEAILNLMKNKGDILISTFAANPNVRGASNIVTISDEFHHFMDSDVSNKKNPLDKVVFEALTPSTSGFIEEDGRPAGKNFFISSPNGEKGMLWDMYRKAMAPENRGKPTNTLVINVPSHWVNPKLKAVTLKTFFNKSERAYEQEYEAKFLKGAGAWLMSISDKVYACVDKARENILKLFDSAYTYYLGIDFGLDHDGTAMVVAHYEPTRPEIVPLETKYDVLNAVNKGVHKEIKDVIVVDYIGYDLPDGDNGETLQIGQIMNDLGQVVEYFRPERGAFDQWSGSIFAQLINEEGFNNIEKLPATQQLNSDMAKLVRQLISEGRLILPNRPDFLEELFRLNETVSREGLVKVEDKDFHDDMFDALCRAVWLAYTSKDSNAKSYKAKALRRVRRSAGKSTAGLRRVRVRSNAGNVRKPGQTQYGRR